MSKSFKMSILEKVPEIYSSVKGEHIHLGPDGYKVALTALLGYTPSNWEVDEIFQTRSGLMLDELQEIVHNKLKYFYVEQYICEMFSAFDKEFSGCITLNNVKKQWNHINSKIPWCKLEEGFRALASKTGVLNYADFYSLFCSTDINQLY